MRIKKVRLLEWRYRINGNEKETENEKQTPNMRHEETWA